jgi:hypothetical protein
MKHHGLILLGFLTFATATAAQPAPEPAPAQRALRTTAPAAPAPAQSESAQSPQPAKAPRAMAIAPPGTPSQPINVRVDVTLTDSKGAPKVLSMTIADGFSGMNRTNSLVVPQGGNVTYSFDADATPVLLADRSDRIRLRITAEAVVPVESERATATIPRLSLKQSQTVILSDGELVELARSADPASDRTFVLSVKATIQREGSPRR